MQRPTAPDRMAFPSEERAYTRELEEYTRYLEGRIEELTKPKPEPKPGAFQELMDGFFGPGFDPSAIMGKK